MKASPVKLSRRGKRPMTQKLRQWDSPDIWKKTELVTSATADNLLKNQSNIETFSIYILQQEYALLNAVSVPLHCCSLYCYRYGITRHFEGNRGQSSAVSPRIEED